MTFDNGSVNGLYGRYGKNQSLWNELTAVRLANLPLVHKWREAAIADGWLPSPTYSSEPVEHACTLTKAGFIAHTLSRPIPGKDGMLNCPDVSVWGPDGAGVKATKEYDFATLQSNLRFCKSCGNHDVETQRYAFADRLCAECGPKMMASLPRNWAD